MLVFIFSSSFLSSHWIDHFHLDTLLHNDPNKASSARSIPWSTDSRQTAPSWAIVLSLNPRARSAVAGRHYFNRSPPISFQQIRPKNNYNFSYTFSPFSSTSLSFSICKQFIFHFTTTFTTCRPNLHICDKITACNCCSDDDN